MQCPDWRSAVFLNRRLNGSMEIHLSKLSITLTRRASGFAAGKIGDALALKEAIDKRR